MTVQHRVSFELADIRALRLECHRCKAAISFAMDQTFYPPNVCPACNDELANPMSPGALQAVRQLVEGMKAVLRMERESQPKFRLSLEYDDPRR